MPQRLFALLLCAALLISAVPPALAEDQPIEAERFVAPTLPPDAIAWDKNHPDILDEDMLYAHSAILIEADTGEVLFEKNADEIMFPASTTKIMTAYIALQMSDLENDVVTVSQNAIDLVPPTYQTIPLIAGEQVPMLDLISVMLIRSGNEAANAVAEYLSGSVESFADLMNQTAQMLGCSPNTHFANPSGVHDENHYTTARDLAVIAQACMKDERFASIVSQTSYDMPATQTESGAAGHPRRTIVGSTAILNPENETSYYRYATGVKTGYTLAAGYCFVGSATKGGIDLISVVLYDGDTRRYEDTKRLFEYGFTQIESITPESLYAEDPRVIDITGFDTSDAQHGELTLGIRAVDEDKDMTIVGRKDNIDFLRENFGQVSSIRWTREFRAPINVGDVMGILTFYSENKGVAEYELVATRSIAARADAPLTLEQIEAYTAQDESPWPRFSLDLLVPPGLILLALIWLIRFIRRHRKKRIKAPKIKPIKKKYLR